MKLSNAIAVLALAASVLFFSTSAYARPYQDHREQVYDYSYFDDGGEGYSYANAGTDPSSWAEAIVEIEDPEENTYGGGYAQYDWKVYITDYDPQADPNLTAEVSCAAISILIGQYDLLNSDYYGCAAANGYANGYRAETALAITEPDDGDVDTDYFSEEIDMSYNGATVYLGDFAYAQAEAYSTSDKVHVYAFGQAVSACEIVEE